MKCLSNHTGAGEHRSVGQLLWLKSPGPSVPSGGQWPIYSYNQMLTILSGPSLRHISLFCLFLCLHSYCPNTGAHPLTIPSLSATFPHRSLCLGSLGVPNMFTTLSLCTCSYKTLNHPPHLMMSSSRMDNAFNSPFLKYILLIMLSELSHFFLSLIPLCPVPPFPLAFCPTLVHVHGS